MKKVLKGFGIILLVLAVVGMIGAYFDKKGKDKPQNLTTTPSYKKIGDQIEVGNFSYMVSSAKFKKAVGDKYSKNTADGVYLLIYLTFRNNDKEEHTLDNSLFKLTNDAGVEFSSSTDGETSIEMSGNETLFLKQCNPGITKSGFLIFEVPVKDIYNLHLSGGMWDDKSEVVQLIAK